MRTQRSVQDSGHKARHVVCPGQGQTQQRFFAGPVAPTQGAYREETLPFSHQYQINYHISLAQKIASGSTLHTIA